MTVQKDRNLLRSLGKHHAGQNDPTLHESNASRFEAEAEVRASKDEAAQLKEQCEEKARQLLASQEESARLASQLAAAEALASGKAAQLQAAYFEISQHKGRLQEAGR